MKKDPKKPLLLLIFDGWGYSENPQHNAIHAANTPTWDYLWKTYPHTLVEASGSAVGLPEGQMGNSEVGHLHMGAGRKVPQDLVRIDEDIQTGTFFENKVLKEGVELVKQTGKTLHIFGLLSDGGVHSHASHIEALAALAANSGLNDFYVHALLDGRDTPPRSAKSSLESLEKTLKDLGAGSIASICGRYYAMDRDKRWDRTELAYDMYTSGDALFSADSAVEALEQAYERDENDEFVKPTKIKDVSVDSGDIVVFMNFRADRARQLTYALTDSNFSGFKRKKTPELTSFITLTQYADNIQANVAYPPLVLKNTLGEYLSMLGCSQLRIAETEKYAHVTFFINGGTEASYQNEERILVPSPQVATYDLQPHMSAERLTDHLVEQILNKQHNAIICNYANPDMVGHTGDFDATVQAIECMDKCLKKIIDALDQVGGAALITADHGNAECMFNENTEQAHTAHTLNKVPLIYTEKDAKFIKTDAVLYDIAPTLLYLLGADVPSEMTGRVLLESVHENK